MNFDDLACKWSAYQIEQRRWFHAHPEASEKEFKTSEHIKAELTRLGIEWRPCGLQTGVLATVCGARPGKTILLRGDMDALEITEQTGCDYASVHPGFMHACGHDCHTSMLLTAAAMANEVKDELSGTIVFAFQPAEEVGTGARSMIEDGAMKGVDACFSMHVWAELQAGTVSMRAGPVLASTARFTIDVEGKSGHGSRPQQGCDAIVMATSIIQNLQTAVSREIAPVETAVVTVGAIKAGTRFNVLPGRAYMEGTTRCFSNEVCEALPEILTRIVTNTAKAHRGEAKVKYQDIVVPTINDAKLAELCQGSAKSVLGPDCLVDFPPSMIGEDFSLFQKEAPGVMGLFGIRNEACGAVWPQHHDHYQVDESMLIKGALLYLKVAKDFLTE